jgi:hypothetical protein
MKTTIIISNNGLNAEMSISHASGKSRLKVQRAMVLRFMDYYDTMRFVKAKGFKGSEPFNIAMQINGVTLWNTATLDARFQATLKLQNTTEGRKRFESRLFALVGFAIRCTETNVDNVTTELEARLLN